MSAIASTPLIRTTETAHCEQCENPIPQGNIVITSRGTGLGGNNRQHIEAHCPHCKCLNTLDREFDGMVWRRIGSIKVLTQEQLTATQQRRREDQAHALRLEEDATEPARDYME